ncbi:MAG: HD domain-containing protein [Deltaproteobacteria bacterium]|nr:MAG: HD domain-containing protein [Deltaproteobacteria bacterium]
MKIDSKFLRSKVARRIFALFILCALLPISVLAFISFTQVTEHLYEQSERRLDQARKALAMSVLERLFSIENELKIFSTNIEISPRPSSHRPTEEYAEHIEKRLKGLALITETGRLLPLFGHIQIPADQSGEQKQHLESGKPLLLIQSRADKAAQIYMLIAVQPQDLKRGILCGEINSLYLWGLDEYNTLPAKTELCVLDQANHVIYSTLQSVPPSFLEKGSLALGRSSKGRFGWAYEEEEYLASFWSVPLRYNFFYPSWTIILSESKEYILKPIKNFKMLFPLIVLLSIWVVLLLSIIQIRRTTDPLEKLQLGTRRIAKKDFESRVTVTSGDEFEELATSFNDMARQLGRQFNALTTMAEIDRAILSALDTEKIVRTVITRMHEFFGYDFVSVTLLDPKGKNPVRTFVESGNPSVVTLVDNVEIPSGELEKLIRGREMVHISAPKDLPAYFAFSGTSGIKSFVLLPLFLKQELAGIITLGTLDSSAPKQEDLLQARQLADQVAVALSNARLIEDLKQFNIETLQSLARAVDAKSPWTHGHSERVTNMALEIGRVLGLTPGQLEDLLRAGLLHDIGKIGISGNILDKPGKLTDNEFNEIRKHSSKGAWLLEPLQAYAHVIPMVKQHHEHFDGKGYPDGLAGEEISLEARILAVADVYDALVSDRPYRSGMERERVIEIIKEEAGKQFDPNVVKAFLEVMTEEESSKLISGA